MLGGGDEVVIFGENFDGLEFGFGIARDVVDAIAVKVGEGGRLVFGEGEIGGVGVFVVTEGEEGDDGVGFAGEVEAGVVEGVLANEAEVDFGGGFFEGFGLDREGGGDGGGFFFEGLQGGVDSGLVDDGAVGPFAEKVGGMLGGVEGVEDVGLSVGDEGEGRVGGEDGDCLVEGRSKRGADITGFGVFDPCGLELDGGAFFDGGGEFGVEEVEEASGCEGLFEEGCGDGVVELNAAAIVAGDLVVKRGDG